MIITLASQKGGAGKSTVAINLALSASALSGRPPVALVDADTQRSCVETLQGHQHSNLTLYEAPERPHKQIAKIKAQVIIVDTPPHSHEIAYQAAAVSDLVIIPVQPSPLDVRAVARTVKALQLITEKYNPQLRCCFLINRITAGTILSGEIRDTLEKHYQYPILKTMLHNREAYKQSLISGQSVIEFDRGSPAAKEISDLLAEIEIV